MEENTSSPSTRFGLGLLGIALALLIYWITPGEAYPQAPLLAAIATLMAVWWIFEVIPIPATSLIPIVAFPAFGLMSVQDTTVHYANHNIFLFLGGFILALALQETGLHKRFALFILGFAGGKPAGITLAFMVSTAFMSMWISNTASVMVMLPIALSVLEESGRAGWGKEAMKPFGIALMLGIAYAADMGGMATLVGTPPNLVFLSTYQEQFPDAAPVSFTEWMQVGLPLAVAFVGLGWWMLTRVLFKLPREEVVDRRLAARLREEMPPASRDEWFAGLVFGLTALLWLTGGSAKEGGMVGWRRVEALSGITDSVIAVGAALALFLLPSSQRKGQALMTWPIARKLPWGVLLLFGGGFALAAGFTESGLTLLLGDWFRGLEGLATWQLILVICLVMTFLTELTSNTATTTIALPVLAAAAVALEIDPKYLMIPATLSASCAFMMPVASPTQAIVFGSGYVPVKSMARAGLWFNFLGVLLVSLLFMALGQIIWPN